MVFSAFIIKVFIFLLTTVQKFGVCTFFYVLERSLLGCIYAENTACRNYRTFSILF